MRKKEKNKNKTKKRRSYFYFLNSEEKKYFIENLSMLLSSGMDIMSALNAVSADVRSKAMKKTIDALKDDIDAGYALSVALKKSRLIPDYAVSLIKIGEKSGRLSENLKVVARQQQKDRNFRSKISSAMMYPMIVFSLTIIIGVGIAWFILPRLTSVFSQLKLELPLITQVIMAIGNFLGKYGIVVFPILIISLAFITYFTFFFSKTKFIGQSFLFALPGTKKMIREIELARTGYLLGTLLEAGVPIVDAIKSIANTTSFRAYQEFYLLVGNSILEGNSFQKSFDANKKSRKLIPASIKQMIAAGEQSGRLPETFLKIGEIFESKTENTAKNLAVILEPILLVLVWLGVVCVALAVILPIYSLLGGLNQEQNISTPPPAPVAVENPANVESEAFEPEEEKDKELEIAKTEIGYLNIRDSASKTGKIIGKALPGEKYKYLSFKNGWYRIILEKEKTGWVSDKYVKLFENENLSETEI